MRGYVKLYSTILTSSIWLEPHTTLRVWITLLALADKDGEVSGSVGGLAHIANVTRDECVTALNIFLSPDPDSRTPDYEGKRVEKIDGGWRVLNAEKYRDMRTETQVEWAEKKRKWREAHQTGPNDDSTTIGQSGDTGDMSEDKPTASSSSSTASSEQTAVVDARELSNLLITRLNQGQLDNPAIGEAANPVPHGHAPSLAAAEEIAKAGVAADFASEAVYAGAKKYKPNARNRQINSLAYLAGGVISKWEQEQARQAAADTSRPVGDGAPSTPRINGKGSTSQAMKLIRLVRERRNPMYPNNVIAEWKDGLSEVEAKVCRTFGLQRILNDQNEGTVVAQLARALEESR